MIPTLIIRRIGRRKRYNFAEAHCGNCKLQAAKISTLRYDKMIRPPRIQPIPRLTDRGMVMGCCIAPAARAGSPLDSFPMRSCLCGWRHRRIHAFLPSRDGCHTPADRLARSAVSRIRGDHMHPADTAHRRRAAFGLNGSAQSMLQTTRRCRTNPRSDDGAEIARMQTTIHNRHDRPNDQFGWGMK